MTLDARVAPPEPTSFDAFHRDELPRAIAAGRGRLAGRDVRNRTPLAIRVRGRGAYTYRPTGDGVAVAAGESDDATVVELDDEAWCEFFREWRTAAGLVYAQKLRCVRGDLMELIHWEPALRALYHGRPIFDAREVALCDLDGAPLDVTKTFRLDSPRAQMHRFLDETGYLVVRDVLSAGEIQELKDAVAALRAGARREDGKSWWAPTAGGDDVLCRITYGNDRSPVLARLFADARVRALVEISGRDLRAATDRVDGVTVLFKNPDVVGGLSDLPWHRDCGLGGHSVMCPLLIVGIHLDAMTPETGELRVLPGSWKASCHFFDSADPSAPRGIGLSANAGDCTVHYGDMMHAAPPPSGKGTMRTTLYLTYMPERAFEVIGPGQAYNDVLLADGSGRVKHLYEAI